MQYVYLIQETDFDGATPTGLYKIGMTTIDVENRKRQYRAGNARRLDTIHKILVINAQAAETVLHHRFAEWRLNHGGGDEWFRFDIEDIDEVIDIMDTFADYQPSVPQPAPPTYAASYPTYRNYSDPLDGMVGFIIGGILLVVVLFGLATLSGDMGGTPAYISPPSGAPANLRSAPQFGEQFEIREIPQGEPVTAYEFSADKQWRRVKLANGQTGWVASNFVLEN